MKRLVIGILAHVDSGKTTLSEALLYRAGELKRLGRVDHRDAFLDSDAQERERGITIFAKQAVLRQGDAEITLLDTPGHVDFSAEMERTLGVLDAAVLVISGTDGVQSHTETLWRLLSRHHIPTFLFVNKMDQAGAEREALLAQLKARLGEGCAAFGEAAEQAELAEALALCDEALMNAFLEMGTLSDAALRDAVARRAVYPCYFGSALRLEGVDALLDGLARYAAPPKAAADFGAQVFKISRDAQGNRLTHCKITGGSLRVRATLTGHNAKGEAWSEKVNQIRIYSGTRFEAVDTALPGMVCALTGLSETMPGKGLGAEPDAALPLLCPVLTYRVELPPEVDAHTALAKLRLLEEEDPQLHLVWNEPLQEIHLQLMGEVQMEVQKRRIAERFGWQVAFGEGKIVYRETIANVVEGVGHFEPLRHYAEVHLLLEPGARGSGICFASRCSEDKLAGNWQRLILTHLEEKAHLGVLTGSPITDLCITLVAGKGHLKHTEGGDFREATYRAVRQGLRQAESVLLEPWYTFRLELPTELIGRAMSDFGRKNAVLSPPETVGELSVLTGSLPVACLGAYQIELAGYTRGRGRLTCELAGYQPCHNPEEVIPAIGYEVDRDVANTADSVFCSHGAGVTVPWNEVPQQMHLPSVLRPAQEEPPQVTAQRAAAYCATLAQDKELMAIFERTYGPVRKDLHTAFAPAEKATDAPFAAAPNRFAGTEYLLVDGYNILFAWEDLKAIAEENLDAAREELIRLLCNYQGFRRCNLILVFDAYKVKGNRGEVEQCHNISVVYTKEAETADMYIEKVTHAIGRSHRVRVATSDGMEQLIILGQGAMRVSARAFREEVDQVERAIRSFLAES